MAISMKNRFQPICNIDENNNNNNNNKITTTTEYNRDLFVDVDDNILDSLTCSICSNIVYKPYLLVCKHLFCSKCIIDWCKQSNTCPLDRLVIHDIDKLQYNNDIMNKINNMKYKCVNYKQGCNWSQTLLHYNNSVKKHIKNCTSREVVCNVCNITYTHSNELQHYSSVQHNKSLVQQLSNCSNTINTLTTQFNNFHKVIQELYNHNTVSKQQLQDSSNNAEQLQAQIINANNEIQRLQNYNILLKQKLQSYTDDVDIRYNKINKTTRNSNVCISDLQRISKLHTEQLASIEHTLDSMKKRLLHFVCEFETHVVENSDITHRVDDIDQQLIQLDRNQQNQNMMYNDKLNQCDSKLNNQLQQYITDIHKGIKLNNDKHTTQYKICLEKIDKTRDTCVLSSILAVGICCLLCMCTVLPILVVKWLFIWFCSYIWR